MSVTINITITSPLDEDDRVLLASAAMMSLTVAQSTGALLENDKPSEPEPIEPMLAAPCGAISPENPKHVCTGVVGHRGRHRFRASLTSVRPN